MEVNTGKMKAVCLILWIYLYLLHSDT